MSTAKAVRVGTRQSELALIQTEIIIGKLLEYFPDWKFEVVKIRTKGDRMGKADLKEIGGKGLFVKEIEEALLNGEIDFAVHSMKDMPYEIPEGLVIAAVSEREDPRDVLISKSGKTIRELNANPKIGTSSLRRQVQLKALRPDLEVIPLRGNIATRLRKMDELGLDGIVLAAAGLKRLKMEGLIAEYFSVHEMVPAVGQGALAVETRKESEFEKLLKKINHKPTEISICAEREFMKALGGSCNFPIGAYARIEGGKIVLTGMVEKNGMVKKATIFGDIGNPREVGENLAKLLGDENGG
ncbi:hydroxymethylbilane synthase [Thermovorax subterraneus]|nr:hydroxymethylbilane synthase [Thermovorax subterraneus]